jgi:hypothetical protein
MLRATAAIGEAVHLLARAGVAGPLDLEIRFDEVTLVCTLRYRGAPLPLVAAEVDVEAMLDAAADDDHLDAGLRQISALLVARLADRTRATARGPDAELVLAFDH